MLLFLILYKYLLNANYMIDGWFISPKHTYNYNFIGIWSKILKSIFEIILYKVVDNTETPFYLLQSIYCFSYEL